MQDDRAAPPERHQAAPPRRDHHVHFIGKPYSLAGLAAKIRETLEG